MLICTATWREHDPLHNKLRPKLSLGMVMTHFKSLWTGVTPHAKFKDRVCILLKKKERGW